MGIDASFLRAPVRLSGIKIDQDLDMHDTNTPAILHRVKTKYIDAGKVTIGPTVDFSGTPTSGCPPREVAFTDLTTGSPISWLWDFGDGGGSTLQNPTHIYEDPGIYDVTLTASNLVGSTTLQKPGYIEVLPEGGPLWDDPFCIHKIAGNFTNFPAHLEGAWPGAYAPISWYVIGDAANVSVGYTGPFYGLIIEGVGTGTVYVVQAGYDWTHVPPYPPYGPYAWFDMYVGGTNPGGAFEFHIRDNREVLSEVNVDLMADPYFDNWPPATRVLIPAEYQALLDMVPFIVYYKIDVTPLTNLYVAVFDANYP